MLCSAVFSATTPKITFYTNVLLTKGQNVPTHGKNEFCTDLTQSSYLIDEGVDENKVVKEMLYGTGQLDISLSIATGLRDTTPDSRSLILGSSRDFSFNRCFHIVP